MINKRERSLGKGEEAEVEGKGKGGRAGGTINKHGTKNGKGHGLHLHRNLILVLAHPVHDFCSIF